MKWYFGINEAATQGLLGNEARMAVLSAKNNTSLSPHLLYYGGRNDFTAWMEKEGVIVRDVQPALEGLIYRLEAEGKYTSARMGHWLRAEICQLETDEEYVLYTDCDVVFCKEFDQDQFRPAIFACAPEFRRDNWNYFNSGVMIINVLGLAADYQEFIDYSSHTLQNSLGGINDQVCYNKFYRHRWSRLDLGMNWKPYWPSNPDANIIHFHGPKIGSIKSILGQMWSWGDEHGAQIGSLLVGHRDSYRSALLLVRRALHGTEGEAMVDTVLDNFDSKFDALPLDEINLEFMNFRLFGE